jgi:hypothetical protein
MCGPLERIDACKILLVKPKEETGWEDLCVDNIKMDLTEVRYKRVD